MAEQTLEKTLTEYLKEGQVPLHMPGHKRRISVTSSIDSHLDFTEIEETDDLHHATGILKQAMDRTAALYGAKRTWYLVNGSTCGNLAGISAMTREGDEVIVARNCHRSVFHALQLRNLHVHWLVPPVLPEFGIDGSLSVSAVAEALEAYPSAKAVIVTSPTYEGVISDIRSIVRLAHAHGIPVFVDEAHGAHLGFGTFPAGAVQCGADLVVQSPHKTLFSSTQTSWMHLQGSLVDEKRVEQQLGIFETSSPSYPLLMSLDGCSAAWAEHGNAYCQRWLNMLADFDETAKHFHHLHILEHPHSKTYKDIFAFDPGKILIRSAMPGVKLQKLLHDRYRFTLEMAAGNHALAMTSAADDPVEIHRFALALDEIEHGIETTAREDSEESFSFAAGLPAVKMTIHDAVECDHQSLPLFEAQGRIAGEYVFLYPPGIPLIMPGEFIGIEQLETLRKAQIQGSEIRTSVSSGGSVLTCI